MMSNNNINITNRKKNIESPSSYMPNTTIDVDNIIKRLLDGKPFKFIMSSNILALFSVF